MRGNRRSVAAGDRARQRLAGIVLLQLRQRSLGEREQRGSRQRCRRAGRVLEHLHGPREQCDLARCTEHGRGMVERPRFAAHRDRRHSQRARQLVQSFARARIPGADPGRRVAQGPRTASAGNGPQRVERAGARACFARRGKHVEIERAGAVNDELPWPKQSRDAAAEWLYRWVADGQEDDVRVLHALELGVPPALLGAIPREHHANAGTA
jgi:hypothetical protein